jgi:hypothetical protein
VGTGICIYFFRNRFFPKPNNLSPQQNNLVANIEPTPTPQNETTQNATGAASLASLKVEINNGSGVKGEADNVAGILKNAGFSDIKTGNADNYNYLKTIVSLKQGIPTSLYQTISNLLKDNYDVASASSNLSQTSLFDILIVVGKKIH